MSDRRSQQCETMVMATLPNTLTQIDTPLAFGAAPLHNNV